jgi:hypothetical protein
VAFAVVKIPEIWYTILSIWIENGLLSRVSGNPKYLLLDWPRIKAKRYGMETE